MTFKHVLSTMAVAACALAAPASYFAAPEISISSVTPSSTFSTYNAINLINDAGMIGNLHDGNFTHKWMTDSTVTGTLVFDLGKLYAVDSTSIWNYGEGCCGNERSVRDFGISYSTNGISYTNFGNFVLQQSNANPFPGESFALGFNARYIKFSLNSNYGDEDYAGLSEVKFFGAPVPEPETYAMLLTGLCLMGAAVSRKKQAG